MAITHKKFQKNSIPARVYLDGSPATIAVSQTGKACCRFKLGFRFQVEDVQVYASTKTGALTFDVQINGVSVLTAPVAAVTDTVVVGSLSSAVAALRGLATDVLTVQYTTDGTGAATNPSVTLAVRAFPCDGEA